MVERFEYRGLKCALRSGGFGIPCGYVQPPDGWAGESDELQVHGGVTWDGEMEALGPGRWIGFDAGHGGDYVPALAAVFGVAMPGVERDDNYMKQQCRRLAEQILEAKEKARAKTS